MLINISSMKIYFAGSIRGGRKDAKLYKKIIDHLGEIGEVLTEHVGDKFLCKMGESNTDIDIFRRDMEWLNLADVIVAEVTTPSLGVGYELGIAEKIQKPILCLYRSSNDKRLSAMIGGNKAFTCCYYSSLDEIVACIDNYFKNI